MQISQLENLRIHMNFALKIQIISSAYVPLDIVMIPEKILSPTDNVWLRRIAQVIH